MTCPNCGTALAPGIRFCPHDGTTVRANPGVEDGAEPRHGGDDIDRNPFIGRTLDGRYRICSELGAGGVGAVYRGEHVEMRKPVAVKVLHAAFARTDTFRKRFEREARAASRLSHPGCVTVLDFGTVARVEPPGDRLLGTPYLVMELVSGELLLDRIEKGRLPAQEALNIARGALSALKHAHGLDIVHRDIKPANIMLAAVGESAPLIKLLDFGLAKSLAPDSADNEQPLTQMGTVFGTPGYLSPEQADGQPADARSDLYSVGVVLFEMVCGRPPFVHKEAIQVVRDHALKPPPKPTRFCSLSSRLENAILKALAKDPKDRFQTADAFAEALASCPELAADVSKAPSLAPRATLAAGNRRKVLTIGVSLLTLVAAGIILASVLRSMREVASPPAPVPVATAPPPVTTPISSSARHHLALAEDYQRRLWCSDTIDELERALRDDPRLRSDSLVTALAIPCLRGRTQAKVVRFFVEAVGKGAIDELKTVASGDPKPDVREGARRALALLGDGGDHVAR